MPSFSQKSRNALNTCHPKIRRVLNEAIKHVDFTVLEGYRGKVRQNRLHEEGKTQVKYPNSKHNAVPSEAVDIAPYPIDWEDRERFSYLAGVIVTIARHMGVKLRWGGDWDRDGELADNSFDDLPHFELIDSGG